MRTPCVTTKAERRLLESARQMLGGNLSEFLLFSCLGEPLLRRCLLLRTHVTDTRPQMPIYRLEVSSTSNEGLPGQRDPLVLAAVLRLLLTDESGRDEVTFTDEELLTLLDWPNTPRVHREIAAAVERYFSTSYRLMREVSREPDQIAVHSYRAQQFIPEYETRVERTKEESDVVREVTTVRLYPGFLKGVSGEGKCFLGVDFERLLLERIAPASYERT